MTTDSLPPGAAEILAELERGELAEGTRSTLARALRAAISGRSVVEILAADARNRRDAALRAMRDSHFAELAPTAAAKAMARALQRAATGRGTEHPAAGTLEDACRAVLACGGPPSWRTVLRAVPRYPLAVSHPPAAQQTPRTP